MPRYLSNRVKRTPQGSLSDDRYRYLDLKQAEPNLGDPAVPGETIPVGTQYQVISLLERPGERFWIPVGGGLIPGSLTIFDEGTITPPGGISSITQLNFVGNSIKAQGYLLPNGNPGTAATITVSPPGNNGEVLFKELGDFSTSPSLVFNGSVGILTIGNGLNVGTGGTLFTIKPTGLTGIGTTNPTQELHIQGDLRLTGTIYDFGNQPGLTDNILVKNNFGGITWISQSSIRAGAGGTYTNVQYHNASGLVDGANNFVYDPINSRVGIGSTLPRYLLDVLGTVNVSGLVTTTNLYVSGISTFNGVVNIISTQQSTNTTTGSLVISGGVGIAQNLNVGGNLNVTGISTLNTANTVSLTSQRLNVTGISTLNTTSVTNLTSQQLNVTGISTLNTTSTTNLNTQSLNVSGIATISLLNSDNNTLQNLKVTGITTLAIAEIEQTLRVFGNTTLSNTSVTNLTSQTLNVTGISTLNTTSTTNLNTQSLNVSGIATISTLSVTNTVFQSLNVTGIATILTLGVTGLTTTRNLRVIGVGTFDGLLDANGGATIDNIQIGISGDNEIDTSTGNLTIDSAGGTITIDDNLIVSGTSTLNGNVTLGDAITDTVSFISRVGTGITPSTNGTLDLGSSLNKWNNVYANAFVGAVIGNADTSAQVSVATTTGTSSYFLTFVDSNNASRLNEFLYTDAGISYNPSTDLLSASNLIISGISTFNGISAFNGNVTLGDVTTDTVTFTARVNSNILPSTNGTLDLGGTLNKWNNIYANSFVGAIVGNADSSSQVSIGTTTGTSSYFLTFVDSNNVTRANEFLYTDAGISYNPSTDLLTISNLSVTGITTLTGLLDANGGATIDNIRIGVAGDNEIDTSTGNLTIDSAGGITTIDDNLIVSGISTFNGNVILGDAITDTVTFTSRVNSSILPSTNGTLDLGGASNRWSTIYATTFNGAITGNADTATKLATARNIAITGDLSWNVNFDGSANVTSIGTLANTGVTAATYGSATTVPVFAVDSKGRITSVTNTGINFAAATVLQSDTVRTISNATNASFFPTFVDSNNVTAAYESLYTDAGISFNPFTDLLTVSNIIVSGISTFNGNTTLGDATTDTVTFNARVNSSVLPSTNGTLDLGSSLNEWNNVYANTFVGAITGNADTATKLAIARNFSITGDVDAPAVSFDGSGNVNLVTTLDNTGVVASTYGSATTVPVFAVDSKGRITSVTNTGINFAAATVSQSDAVRTISNATNASFFPTFVDSNNVTAAYESLYTDAGISFNPSTDLLSLTNLSVSGNTTLGDATTDTVTFTARVNSSVLPSTNGTLDLGGALNKWNNIYANTFVGTITGNADTATKLAIARSITITGDLSWSVNFDGSANVTSTGTLANTGVTAATYGSSSTVPVFTVDSKGRITSVTNTGISGINASSVSAAGLNTQVQFNDNGFFAGNATFTFNKTTNTLSVSALSGGTISGTTGTFSGDVAVNGGDITTTSLTASIFDATSTTVNAFGDATTLNLGHDGISVSTTNIAIGALSTGTKTINIGTGGVTGTTTNINIAPLDSLGTTTVGNNVNVRGRLQTSSNTSLASWTTTGIAFDSAAATYTNTSIAGTYTPQVANSFNRPTFASTNLVTVTDAATVYINNSPLASTNTTITDAWSIFVDAGFCRFDSGVTIGGITPSRGPILTGTISNAGDALYTDGTYTLVPLTGGRGSLAYATIVVSLGVVTGVTITREGSYYQAGDILSASSVAPFSLTGSGFTWTVATVRTVDFQVYSSAARIRLGSSNTAVSAGTELGSILFGCQDANAGGRGDKVRLIAAAENTSGGGQLQIWTSANGGEPTLGFLFGGNNDFRLYNAAGTFYHTFANEPTANRTITLPDFAGTVLISNTTVNTDGYFYSGTTTPTGTTRLNYSGYLYPTFLNLSGSAETVTAATHYFVETGSDGFVRPKTLANVRTEIVTSTSMSAALGNGSILGFGLTNQFELFHDGTNGYIDINVGDLFVRDNTTTRFTFQRTTGNFTAGGTVTANSDIRLKENIEVISNPLEKVSQIRGVTFTRNDQDDKEKRHAGVIAQEVEKVLPEVVMEGIDGIKSVAYGNLIGLLIEAIKEQQSQINTLNEKLNQFIEN